MAKAEVIAARFFLLLTLRGESDSLVKAAEKLSTSNKRRVLLLLAIWILIDHDHQVAEQIARMLPANHPGVMWALAGAEGELGDTVLDDLGDPISVEQVLRFMQPKQKKN